MAGQRSRISTAGISQLRRSERCAPTTQFVRRLTAAPRALAAVGFTSRMQRCTSTIQCMPGHTLNIDLAAPAVGPGARVAVELTAESARELVAAIQAALDAVPASLCLAR